MSMDSKKFKVYSPFVSVEFDYIQDCIKYAADFCKRMIESGCDLAICHVSIFDNESNSLIGFVFVRRGTWIRVDVNSNYLNL